MVGPKWHSLGGVPHYNIKGLNDSGSLQGSILLNEQIIYNFTLKETTNKSESIWYSQQHSALFIK